MIKSIIPTGMAASEVFGNSTVTPLLQQEAIALGDVSGRRRRDFTAGRHCARTALQSLGVDPTPLLPATTRAPIWPLGIIGSISHCPAYCVATVTKSCKFKGVGVDAEVQAPLPAGIIDRIAVADELHWIDEAPMDSVYRDRLLFSAKESVYKAWFPITGRWLGFEDVAVTFSPQQQKFSAKLLRSTDASDVDTVANFEGRYAVTESHLLTLVIARR